MTIRSCSIAVIGLGLMGSAALNALARRGADVLGFDPLRIGDSRGSSHGSCRVYRRFNFESEAYTALSDRAWDGWRESGRTILMPSPVLEAGPPGSGMVAASRAAAERFGAVGGPASGGEANAMFPAFALPEDWDVVVQDSGGILLAEQALRALREPVAERIIALPAQMAATPAGICISTEDGDIVAEQVIVATGPWIAGLVPGLARHLSVTRQAVGWFAPAQPEAVQLGEFPVFLVEGRHGMVYGFPDFEGRGVKAALHEHGPVVGPDSWAPPASDAELAPVGETLRALIPAAAGPIVDRDICLYTNTRVADVRADQGEEFVIDRLPQDPRVIVASPCSGHGAKFATAIGEMLAMLALDPGYVAPEAFRVDRFSGFGGRAR